MTSIQRQIISICAQSQGASISEIQTVLSKKNAQLPSLRTLRRYIKQLVENQQLIAAGNTKSRRYFASQDTTEASDLQKQERRQQENKPQALCDSPSLDDLDTTEADVQQALEYSKTPLIDRKPVAYSFEWFDDYEPNISFYLSEDEKSLLLTHGKRYQINDPAGTYARKIFDRLIIDLSYNSSRLEGNTYTMLETEVLLSEGVSPDHKLEEEKVMILNHKEAIRFLVEKADTVEPSFDTFCTPHYLLSDGLVDSRYSGYTRDTGVRIGQSTYIPLESQNILNAQLTAIGEKAQQILNPFEQSLFLLIHLGYLQSFIDVNKRTSRLSANIPLIRNNLVPLSCIDLDKDEYIAAMISIYEQNSPRALTRLFIKSYLKGCEIYDATIDAIIFDERRVLYRNQRRKAIGHIIQHNLHGANQDRFIRCLLQEISEVDQPAFLEHLQEDLDLISPARIAGLGVSLQELVAWQTKAGETD